MQWIPSAGENGSSPGDEDLSMSQTASLAANDCGRYEDRWVTLEFDKNSPCIWTRGIERLRVPVRHGEGKFVTNDHNLLDRWDENGQLVARYVDPDSTYPPPRMRSYHFRYHQTSLGGTLPASVTPLG